MEHTITLKQLKDCCAEAERLAFLRLEASGITDSAATMAYDAQLDGIRDVLREAEVKVYGAARTIYNRKDRLSYEITKSAN